MHRAHAAERERGCTGLSVLGDGRRQGSGPNV